MNAISPDAARAELARRARVREARAEIGARDAGRADVAAWCEQGPPTMVGPMVLNAWQRDLCRRWNELPGRIRRGERVRVIIGAHPQGGKSEIVARRGLVWLMAQHGIHVALCSYADTLAVEHSREARALASDGRARVLWPHLGGAGTTMRGPDGRAIRDTDDDWGVPHRTGGAPIRYVARGTAGGLSGRAVDLVVIDDPFKDEVDAASPARREAVWRWYRSAVHARVVKRGGGIVIMHTRWHEDDLAGRVLAHAKATGETWEVWSYPVEALAGDLLGRSIGELLDGWTAAMVQEVRALGESLWQAAYQQTPTSETGNVVRRSETLNRHRYDRAAAMTTRWDDVWSACDPTFGKSATSDSVSIQVWARKGADRYLLDCVTRRMSYTELRQEYRDIHKRWPIVRKKILEKTANGQALHDDLHREIPGIELVTVPTNVVPGKFQQTAFLWQAGNVWLPDADIAPWLPQYVEVIVTAPACPHDDAAAATAHALSYSVEVPLRGPAPFIPGFTGRPS